jgi:hypothetical protein
MTLAPAAVRAVGSLAATTYAFMVKAVSTSMMAMSKSWPWVPYARLPPSLESIL